MRPRISGALREAVRVRAAQCCEYCLVHENDAFAPHEADHVIAVQHGGETALTNLAFACCQCNHLKGPNLASVDPETKNSVFLFNPRTDQWSDHFDLEGARIVALSAKGRATAALLKLNSAERRELRELLIRTRRYPPPGLRVR